MVDIHHRLRLPTALRLTITFLTMRIREMPRILESFLPGCAFSGGPLFGFSKVSVGHSHQSERQSGHHCGIKIFCISFANYARTYDSLSSHGTSSF